MDAEAGAFSQLVLKSRGEVSFMGARWIKKEADVCGARFSVQHRSKGMKREMEQR